MIAFNQKTMKPTNRIVVSAWQTASLLALAFCLASAPGARAAYDYWAGVPGTSVDTNWTTPANWTSAVQTYYNEVEFLGVGANPNNVYTVNNVLNATTGVSQMPIWELDYTPTNGNYTTLIAPGVTMNLAANNGSLKVGADLLHTTFPATSNAVETISFVGPGAALTMNGSLYVGQGSPAPLDTHNVTFDLSGLDNFTMSANGNYIYLASSAAARANGVLYLAKTNNIALGNGIQTCNQSSSSNSLPIALYLGIANTITLGSSGNFNIGQTGVSTNGVIVEFNPAFLGGATPPAATFNSSATGGRIGNIYVCNTSQSFPGYGLFNLSGGSVNVLVGALQVGLSSSGLGAATGVVSFDMGTINASSAYLGRQQSSAGGMAVGTVNINSNATYGVGANLVVGGTISLAAVTGTLTPGTAGTLNINGGTLSAGSITSGGGAATVNSTSGAITVTGTAGTLAAPLTSLALTNSTLTLSVLSATTNVVASTLTTAGTNFINIASVPPQASYPAQIPLVKYASLGGAGYNFGIGTLPALCNGYLVNDTANSSVDLYLTSGPVLDVWSATANNNWDTSSANWNNGQSTYADGNFTVFGDGAVTGAVDLVQTVMPSGITVSNNALPYSFLGGGSIAGSGGLIKAGTNILVIDNSGINAFTGGITISGGALQVGSNDYNGNLPAVPVANSGALIFDRQDTVTFPNAISGSGGVVEAGSGTVELSGANTFSGAVFVTNNSTLQFGGSSAAGAGTNSVIIANGSTMDANGNACYKPIVVSGTGVNGNGAIINSGGAIYDSSFGLATNIMLTGDTLFSIPTRWDLGQSGSGSVLSTGGHPYNLSINASGYFEWKNLAVDASLANINLEAGTLGLVGSTTFGNSASNLVVESGAQIDFYGSAVYLHKGVDMQGAEISNLSGNNIMNGVLTLESGYQVFNIGTGTTLMISNVITGPGTYYQQGGAGTVTMTGNSPNFTGGIDLYAGTLTLNGTIGSGITSLVGTTLAGSGVASNLVDVAGAFYPGGQSAAGTFTAAGGLTLESSATLTMDLKSTTGIGGGTNDLINVVGDLTPNGNTITINPISGTLANGTYTLITYTGNLNGSFAGAAMASSSRYNLVLDTSVPHQVRVQVTGVPNLLVWNNGANNSQWDVQSSANWTNLTTHVEDLFYAADTAVLDDSESLAKYPSTSLIIPGGVAVIPGLLTNSSTVNYTISGAGKISGGAAVVKLGASTLTMNTTNDFSGGINILGGTVIAHTNHALGSALSPISVTNGATVDIGYALGSEPLTVSGSGVGGNGALVNNSGNPLYDSSAGLATTITLTGNTTFGGTTRWDLGDRGVTGTTLSTGGNPFNLTYVGSAGTYFEWDNLTLDTNLAGITISPNLTLGAIGSTTFGNPTNTLTISSNATLVFYNDGTPSPILNKQVQMMNGSTLENGGGTTISLGPIILGTNSSDVCTFNIGGTLLAVSNTISGPGSLVKYSSGSPLYLGGVNTYTGNTVVSNGVLALTGSGSISSSPTINLVSGATLDVSARTDQTLTLASGQTLIGAGTVNGNLTEGSGSTVSPAGLNSIGTLTVTNAVTLSGTTIMEVNKTAGTRDQISAGGGITYGGVLNVTNLAGSLTVTDSFKLFTAKTYNGSFASIAPATPGAGLMWNTGTLSSGILSISAAVSVPPTIGTITVASGNVVITGTNNTGSAGTYHVLSTTNLTLPLANWTVLTNGSFNADGSFSTTNTVGAGQQQFYLIQVP